MSNLYVYCIGRGFDGDLLQSIQGLEGKAIDAVGVGPLRAAVSEADFPLRPERQTVLRHQEIVQSIYGRVDALPLRFGTVVPAPVLDSVLESCREQIESGLDRVRGSAEISLRVRATGSTALDASDEMQPNSGPGTEYLNRKLAGFREECRRQAAAEEIRRWFSAYLGDLARDWLVHSSPVPDIVALSCLVDLSRFPACADRLRDWRRARSDLQVAATGPWPPYSVAGQIFENKTFHI